MQIGIGESEEIGKCLIVETSDTNHVEYKAKIPIKWYLFCINALLEQTNKRYLENGICSIFGGFI